MRRVSPAQFGGPLWQRTASELPEHLKTGLGGDAKPRQLKMFMSGQEIMDEYQPLDGDRKSRDVMQELSRQHTRPQAVDGKVNYPVERQPAGAKGRYAWGNTTGGSVFERSEGGTARKLVDTREETDSEVWGRKLEETKLAPDEYDKAHWNASAGGPEMSDITITNPPVRAKHEGTWSFEEREHSYYVGKEMEQDARYEAKMEAYTDPANSLYNKIKKEGVQKPVSLNDPGNKSRFGDSGKPQVAGGHHRLSAQFDIDPQRLMPVLHWAGGTSEAKKSEYYKYT